MRIVLDIETDKFEDTTRPWLDVNSIWCIVCKDIDTGEYTIFRRVTDERSEKERVREFISKATRLVGHNILGFDVPVLIRLCGLDVGVVARCVDTLVLSKLVNYSREGGHSIDSYGLQYGIPKGTCTDFSQYSQEMEDYCVRDVDICARAYADFVPMLADPNWSEAITAEHQFQTIVNSLSDNGFGFDVESATTLLRSVVEELAQLDGDINASFPPRLKLVREVHPCLTKHGTLHRKDFRFVSDGDLSEYNGGPFCRCVYQDFNPSSHRQVVEVLSAAGWRPTDRTATAIKTARESNLTVDNTDNLKYSWKINEANLMTLPDTAPQAARSLARRILVESRRRTLTEWIGLVHPEDNRIHGKFYSIGAWTHRMAHQAPNTANIPNSHDTQGKVRLYGAEMRSLWSCPPERLLVGVDAEGIQLRIFAHYIDDKEFTEALVNGKKDDKTDPHSLNKRILGGVCKSRAAAKRFIYALLLGAGIRKLAEVLECNQDEARSALNRLLERYSGWQRLKDTIIPQDAARGYFIGLDGREVKIHGNTQSERQHLAMSGYLQNGEAVCMKHATLRWHKVLSERDIEFKLVNMVHDEWQVECKEDWNTAIIIADEMANSLRWVGEHFKLKCPLAGSFLDDNRNYTIGRTWKETH